MKLFILVLFLLCSKNIYALNIDPQSVTVSGISSGSYMAGQMHMAYSKNIQGAALIAGGPYFCSMGYVLRAMYTCMNSYFTFPDVDQLYSSIQNFEELGWIDPTIHLADDKVFILTGKNDSVVEQQIALSSKELYIHSGLKIENITTVDHLPVGHAFPTEDYGNPCSTPRESPFISSCKYDTTEKIFETFYGPLKDKAPANKGSFYSLPQSAFYDGSLRKISMAENAIVYVPESCKTTQKCKLHIAFHGCRQSIDDIGDQFFSKTGYNNWAESNNIVVLYPQATANALIGNPKGCWDWWGYSGSAFFSKNGKQIKIVYKMLRHLLDSHAAIHWKNKFY